MADDEVRDLERAWRRTGELDDEARLLLARLRAGLTTVRRLELAAALGDPAALCAVTAHRRPAAPLVPPQELTPRGQADWLRLTAELAEEAHVPLEWDGVDLETALRVRLALLEAALGPWQANVAGTELAPVADELGAPCDAVRGRCLDLSRGDEHLVERALRLSRLARELRAEPLGSGLVGWARDLVLAALSRNGGRRPVEIAGPSRATLQEQLVPWLLGHHDPLREGTPGRRPV